MNTKILEIGILFGGIIHLAILSAGLVMIKVLNWNKDLKKLDALTEHIIWTHASYVWLIILGFGVVSIAFPTALINSQPLGISISIFISLFWGIRLFIQFFYFDARPYLGDLKLKLGFHGLTICFAYLTVIYGIVAYFGFSSRYSTP